MTSENTPLQDEPPADTHPARRSSWRWAAPMLSVLVLSILVARVTTCGERAERVPELNVTPEPPDHAASDEQARQLEPRAPQPALEATPPQPTGGVPATQAQPAVGKDLELLGGSKSGFGGLGLRGSGRMPESAPTPSQAAPP